MLIFHKALLLKRAADSGQCERRQPTCLEVSNAAESIVAVGHRSDLLALYLLPAPAVP
jgi:hypothetical protein